MHHLTALEQKDGHLTQVEVDEVTGLVSHVASEVPAHDAVPSGVVLLVELLLDVGGDVLLDVVFFESLKSRIHFSAGKVSQWRSFMVISREISDVICNYGCIEIGFLWTFYHQTSKHPLHSS